MQYLNKLSNWLEIWEILSKGNLYRGLTTRTFEAFRSTCQSLIGVCKFSLTNFDIKYLLLGKFQTDLLEDRFSLYRQLSGSNYYISLVQILESEKKIRIKNLLSVSTKHSKIILKQLCFDEKMDPISKVNLKPFEDFKIEQYYDINKEVAPILVYISGYASFKIGRKIQCDIYVRI